MGEIKSTLDLVMEKTKNLNLSHEEQQEQKNKEIKSRIRGLLQKYQDQVISIDRLKSEYRNLQKDYRLSENTHLISEICERIELENDNQPLLELLRQFKISNLKGIRSVLQGFQDTLGAAAQNRTATLKEEMAQKHFISGTAVVPNLEADEVWREKAKEIRAKFAPLLNGAKTKLLAE
jgi:hypothetical protein